MNIQRKEQQMDRIKLTDIWSKNIQKCNETFGTSEYPTNVSCLLISLVDVKNGPSLRTTADKYVENELEKWKEDQFEKWKDKDTKKARNPGWQRQTKQDINYRSNAKLYSKIVQLLVDNNYAVFETGKVE